MGVEEVRPWDPRQGHQGPASPQSWGPSATPAVWGVHHLQSVGCSSEGWGCHLSAWGDPGTQRSMWSEVETTAWLPWFSKLWMRQLSNFTALHSGVIPPLSGCWM